MTDDRLIHAFDRLEQAVVRLEAQLPPRPAPVVPDEGLRARCDELEERHAALRDRTAAAVARLSRLLEATRGE